MRQECWEASGTGDAVTESTMRIIDRFLNTTEEIALKELFAIGADNSLRVFAKPKLSDVLKNDTYLENHIFSYYVRSHFDFLGLLIRTGNL
jgi:hypothetical protein